MATDNVAHTRVTSEQVGAKSTYGVVLYDASGNVISSFGGGTQYTDGDVDSTVTGTAAMGKDPSNVLYALQLDASKNLKVSGQGGLGLPSYDYVSLAVASTTDTYSFKTGGSGGTLVATVTITYTDSTKAVISTVVKT